MRDRQNAEAAENDPIEAGPLVSFPPGHWIDPREIAAIQSGNHDTIVTTRGGTTVRLPVQPEDLLPHVHAVWSEDEAEKSAERQHRLSQ